MKLIDWNCKRCGIPLPDVQEDRLEKKYLICPSCGAKHLIDAEPRESKTFVERVPWPGWVESTTISHREKQE